MLKQLKFSGPQASARMFLLYVLFKTGADKHKERTREDVMTEADLDDLFEAATVSYDEARAAGTVPEQVAKDLAETNEQREMKGMAPVVEPLVMAGLPARFLRPLAEGEEEITLTLDPARTWKTLRACVDRAIPTTHTRDTRRVRDLVRFLEDAKTIESSDAKPGAARPQLAASGATREID